MSTGIRTNAAAEILGVSPNTLRSWERRFGYPQPSRTPGNHRQYELVELQTLRDALAETGNISTAIELARQRQSAPATSSGLQTAIESFDENAADRAMEESLALRPLERSIEELLRPTLDELAADPERARVWLPLGHRLAPQRPPPGTSRLAAGGDPAAGD
jgi:DNA-binding transcriptional MerR regulator